MEYVMILLVAFGLAFDIFAIAVSQGAVLKDVKARSLVLMCLIVCAWQGLAMALGFFLSSLLNIEAMKEETRMVWTILTAAIFIALGGIKIFLVYYKRNVPEVRSEINFGKICSIAASTSIYTLFAGFASGLIRLSPVWEISANCIMTIALVILGVFVGYRNGELNKGIYRSGGGILTVAGIIVIIQYLSWYMG